MKVLHLTLKKKWFDMIESGEKKEEYRDLKKHWVQRFCEDHHGDDFTDANTVAYYTFKPFTHVIFKNGYSGGAPIMSFKIDAIEIDTGFAEWGAEPGKKYFVIKLGERVDQPKPVMK